MLYFGNNNVFHLNTKETSYIFRAMPSGHLESLYYGRKIEKCDDYAFLYDKHNKGYGNTVAYSQKDTTLSLDHIPLEYSSFGKGDFRNPSIQLRHENGEYTTDFLFVKAEKTLKPHLKGLPSSYGENETLCVTLKDKVLGASLELYYSVFEEANVITRSVRLTNDSGKNIKINSILSMQLDIPDEGYTMLTFDGAWAKERSKNEHKLTSGVCSVGSITGTSSNRHNPFFVVKADGATQYDGDCYGFNLVYSGNHIARTEISTHGILRIQNGINPFEFDWLLKAGESFDTPEAVMTFGFRGLNSMSQNMHRFVKEHIVRGKWKYKERPVLVNNWEGTYFNFNEKKILEIAKAGKAVGAEMFVLDDGWFGKRDNDNSSLGDWYVDKKKLPNGIEGLSKKINAMGLKFGLWVEPEMISPKSDLYKAHPDWAMASASYEPSQGRNQLILDLTRREVREYITNTLTDVFRYGNIEYIKWDMNRLFSDVYSHRELRRMGEMSHRYVLGLYEILDTLTQKFPDILFESCSSGGNRFDLGMFCYMPQCWTSDNTDALDRIFIQSGTYYGYPQSVMGMHVAAAPTESNIRATTVEHRFNVASFGLLGYELDMTKLSGFDKAAVKRQIEFYKEHRKLLQFGTFWLIDDFFKSDIAKWQIVSEDKTESILGYFVDRVKPNCGNDVIKFRGLDETFKYEMHTRDQLVSLRQFGNPASLPVSVTKNMDDSKLYDFIVNTVKLHSEKEDYVIGGDSLMYSGFKPRTLAPQGGPNSSVRRLTDTDSRMYILKKAEN